MMRLFSACAARSLVPVVDLAAAFDRLAPAWDAAHGPRSRRRIGFALRAALLRDLVDRLPGRRVLDVGCGTGLYLLPLADALEQGVGIDISPAMVECARRNAAVACPAADLRFEVLASHDLAPAVHGRFDLVFFYGSLEHIGEQGRAVEQAVALLRPEGLLVVVILHPLHPRGLLARSGARRGASPPLRLFAPCRLREWAARCGLTELPIRLDGPAGLGGARRRFRLCWVAAAALMPAVLGNRVLVFRNPAGRTAFSST